MDLNELTNHFTNAALIPVKAALCEEVGRAGATALSGEAEHALRGLLRDASLLDGASKVDLRALQKAIQHPDRPESDEIELRAKDVADVMAPAWFQFLHFGLSATPVLTLGEYLLPRPASQVSSELWDALRSSINGLPLGSNSGDVAQGIMRDVARSVFRATDSITLPSAIWIRKKPETAGAYLAGRK